MAWRAGYLASLIALIGLVLAAPPGHADTAPGDACSATAADTWLIGGWANTYYQLTFRREGETIRWHMSRERHPTERWGEKPAIRASGTASAKESCAVELDGAYDWSEKDGYVGVPLRYRGRVDGASILSGEIYGRAREWLPMKFRRQR